MRKIEKRIYKASELNKQALMKAYGDFLECLDDTEGVRVTHNVPNFKEVSDVNNWEYYEDGTFYSGD